MIGVPVFYNLAFVPTDNIGGMDAEFLIALKKGHRPTKYYMKNLRKYLARKFPGASFYFQPADIVTQVLNFGHSSPVSVQIEGNDLERSYHYASRLQDDLRQIPGVADVHINEVLDYPTLQVDVDRARAAMLGMSQKEVSNTLLTSLSSSVLVAPSFFLNPVNNVNYSVAVQIPIERVDSLGSLLADPGNLRGRSRFARSGVAAEAERAPGHTRPDRGQCWPMLITGSAPKTSTITPCNASSRWKPMLKTVIWARWQRR